MSGFESITIREVESSDFEGFYQHQLDLEATVESSRRPGMDGGGGAIAAHAAASAVSTGIAGMMGASGRTVEADARHLANQISDELKHYFLKQGWTMASKN